MYNYLKELFFKCFLNRPVISAAEAECFFDLLDGNENGDYIASNVYLPITK